MNLADLGGGLGRDAMHRLMPPKDLLQMRQWDLRPLHSQNRRSGGQGLTPSSEGSAVTPSRTHAHTLPDSTTQPAEASS